MGRGNEPPGSRSVSIDGNAQANVIVTGDHNTATLRYEPVTLPPPEQVEIGAELRALRALLTRLDTPDQKKIANALVDAEDELARAQPDRDEIGQALDRALGYAKKAQGFADVVAKLTPHIKASAAWLGSNWHKLGTRGVGNSAHGGKPTGPDRSRCRWKHHHHRG